MIITPTNNDGVLDLQCNLVPIVVEQSARGWCSYVIFSLLLKELFIFIVGPI